MSYQTIIKSEKYTKMLDAVKRASNLRSQGWKTKIITKFVNNQALYFVCYKRREPIMNLDGVSYVA